MNTIGFQLRNISMSLPSFTSNDLLVVKRGGAYEVWTARKFKANELKLAPHTTEFKDRYWTSNRASLAHNSEQLSPEKGAFVPKVIVCDGRLRSTPSCDGRTFGLFWIVTRGAGEPNMVTEPASVTQQAVVTLPGDKHVVTHSWTCETLPQLEIMRNPKALKENVRLCVAADVLIAKAEEKARANLVKIKELEAKDKATAAAASGKVEPKEPPMKKSKTAAGGC